MLSRSKTNTIELTDTSKSNGMEIKFNENYNISESNDVRFQGFQQWNCQRK